MTFFSGDRARETTAGATDNDRTMGTTTHAIALVMIVRNEARCLARCLASARAHVDDLLVLDTGSTDGTPDIARQCGARVAHFNWVDDFAAARNAALAQVDAPWRLVLDADEWVDSGAPALAALRSQAPDFIGLLSVDSQVRDESGSVQHAPSWLPRLLPRGVSYSGRIHEQPLSALPRRRLDVHIGHDGYLPEHLSPKRGRNRTLLHAALAEHPDDAYWRYQLGKDFEVHGDHAQALPHYQAAWTAGESGASWRHDLLLRLLFTLKKLGHFEAALELAGTEQTHWQHSPDYFFTLGDVLLDAALARPALAAEWLPMIELAWLRAIEIGEQPDLPDTVRGRGSHLAAHNLAAFHESLGHADQAALWRERSRRWRAGGG
jgi:glycosyltransferase involved in cell wall biosynthesis